MTELPDGFIDGGNVSYDPGTEGDEGDVVEATEIVQPTQYDQGTIEPPADPETVEAFHVYTRDVRDTDLTYVQGAPIDTEAIRKWVVDKGYPVIAVDAELDADGASTTGLVSIRTPIVAPDIAVNITRADPVTNNSTSSLTTYITATAIAGVTGHTYSGTLTYGAEFQSTDPVGMVRVRPMVNGVQQTVDDLSVGDSIQQLTFPIDVVALPATGTLGLTFRNFTSGATVGIQNGFITGTLTSDQPKGEEIPEVEWADYAGVRDQAIVETVVAWDDTAEGATVAVPDLDRIIALQMHIENHGYEVQQITGGWNFTTPDAAPTTPELHVFARGAVDPAVTDAFLYSEIQQSDRDAFEMHWSAVEHLTRVTRRQNQEVATDQYEYSFPAYFAQPSEPTGDVRDGDIWDDTDLPEGERRFQRIDGAWIEAFDYVVTNEGSVAIGRNVNVSAPRATAVGQNASVTGDKGTAIGRYSAADANANAIGNQAVASGNSSNAIGSVAVAAGQFSTAIGHDAETTVDASNGLALGTTTLASAPGAHALGNSSVASGAQSLAIGGSAEATNQNAVAIGQNADGKGDYGTAIGGEAAVNATGAVSVGWWAKNSGENATAIGRDTTIPSTSQRSVAIGYDAEIPASTPDLALIKANKLEVERSNGSGATTLELSSPDGTAGVIAVTDADGLTVNGNAVGGTSFTASDTSSIDLTLSGGTLSAAAIFGTTAGTVAQGNHMHAQLHDALTVTDSAEIDFTLTGQDLTASLKTGSIGPTKLNQPYQGVIPFASGKYYSTVESAYGMSGAYGTFAVNANRTYYLPFWVPSTTTFDQIGINVQTAVAASNARLGIFNFDQSLTTATLVLDAGAVSTAATGSVFLSISQQLTAGWWWLAVNCSHTPSLRSFTPADGFACNSTGTIIAARIKATDTYGAYSATETADADGGTGILILMRAA